MSIDVNPGRTHSPARRAMVGAIGSAAIVSLGGCASLARDPWTTAEPVVDDPVFVAPPDRFRPRVALVMSGGSARGFAHLGLLRVLEDEGLRPDLVVGTSAGAIVGALYASGLSTARIEHVAGQLDWSVLFDIDPLRTLLGGIGLGLVSGARLERFLRQHLRLPLQRFPTPFAAVAADMESGEIVTLNHGDAPRAVRASAAVPGVYAPVRSAGRLLGDGQIVSPLPVSTARRLGSRHVLACDVVYPPHHSEITTPVSMLFQSLVVSGWRHVLAERAHADLVIAPEIRSSAQLGLGSRDWLVRAGEQAARSRLVEIRRLFERG